MNILLGFVAASICVKCGSRDDELRIFAKTTPARRVTVSMKVHFDTSARALIQKEPKDESSVTDLF